MKTQFPRNLPVHLGSTYSHVVSSPQCPRRDSWILAGLSGSLIWEEPGYSFETGSPRGAKYQVTVAILGLCQQVCSFCLSFLLHGAPYLLYRIGKK